MSFKIENSIPHQLHLLHRLKRQLADREMKKLGLTRSQWQTLGWLAALGNDCTQQELLKATEFDRAQLARLLDAFEKQNIIQRKEMPEDRRLLVITLTNKGNALLEKVKNAIQFEAEVMLRNFTTQEKKTLDKFFNQLAENITKELK
ncbi:MAG: transcriptional regulator, MarR family [Gammaproteobacteria bacterium]|jgi:DNA-binding MarR family transcriptional regulator|nr:transcriptional regulator, MarR family [Gammaproteobacteria bacterium]